MLLVDLQTHAAGSLVSDRPSPAKLAAVETAIDRAILERIDRRWQGEKATPL